MKQIPALLACLTLTQVSSHAAVLFSDTFDRANNGNIDAELTGITNNTGSALGIDGVYTSPHVDPANNPTAGTAPDGGAVRILSNTLQLAVGAGTSNAFVNHNFVNSAILAAGGFSVSIDVTGLNQSTKEQGGAFAIGMSLAEANASDDAWNVGTVSATAPSMTGAFNVNANVGSTVPGPVGGISSDFWAAVRGDGSLVWGGNTGNVMGVTGLAKTGTITVNFGVTSFDAGSTVNYEVFYSPLAGVSTSKGTGSFVWSGTNENYIGLDSRDNTAVGFDNFTVATVPEPSAALLSLFGMAGLLRRRR